MRRFPTSLVLALTVPAFGLLGCGDDDPPPAPPADAACQPGTESGCAAGQVCEEVENAAPRCFAPVTLRGHVFSTTDEMPIEGARVVARDANDAALSPVAISAADGSYELSVPAKRNGDGSVVVSNATLRADAAGFLTFPLPPRTALPLDLATSAGDPPILESTATDIGLIPLGDDSGLGGVSGRVHGGHPGGTLVVADGVTGIADVDGDYAIFNVPAGSVAVQGYATGVNLVEAMADVVEGSVTTGVDLEVASTATATVSGSVQIVNAPGGSVTSVILALEDTFNAAALRGESPPGLRAGNVSGAWSIVGVPDGEYVVLAAFENDGLVRDPDTSIGGTEIVHLTVAGADQAISQGFKVTGALAVIAPGAAQPEVVTGTPTFQWEDDSSEDSYDVRVMDALGNETWKTSGVMGPRGNAPATVEYAGPALEPGMYYQFRATSIKDGVPISSTEDLLGVFVAAP